jgi:hypothetical protein
MAISTIDGLIHQKRYSEALLEIMQCDWIADVDLLKRKAFVEKKISAIPEYLATLATMANLSEDFLDKEFYICELIGTKNFEKAYKEKTQLMQNRDYLSAANAFLTSKNQLFINSFLFYRAYSFEELKKSCLLFIDSLDAVPVDISNRMRLFITSLMNREQIKQQFHPNQFASYLYYPGLDDKWQYPLEELQTNQSVRPDFQAIAGLASIIQNNNSEPYVAKEALTPPEFDDLKGTYNWSAVKLKVGDQVLNQTEQSFQILKIIENSFELADFPPMAPEVMISLLKPKTVIKPHHGITNIKLTVHIPVDIPNGDLGLKVVDEIYHWEKDTAFIFDDTYIHEAWNQTNDIRTVLIFDVWNPQLLTEERRLIKFTVNKLQKWNEALYLLNKQAR